MQQLQDSLSDHLRCHTRIREARPADPSYTSFKIHRPLEKTINQLSVSWHPNLGAAEALVGQSTKKTVLRLIRLQHKLSKYACPCDNRSNK